MIATVSTVGNFFDNFCQVAPKKYAIAPEVMAQLARGMDREEILTELNRAIPNQAGFGAIRHWEEGIGFYDEAGRLGQVRLDVPRLDAKGKAIKYESPSRDRLLGFFLPPTTSKQRERINDRMGIDMPLGGELLPWLLSAEGRGVRLVVAEGCIKPMALIEAGILAVGILGVTNIYAPRLDKADPKQLKPELKALFGGRPMVLAFDCDTKKTAVQAVDSARHFLGTNLKNSEVAIAAWDPTVGKGPDDLILAAGEGAIHEAIAAAVPYPQWRRDDSQRRIQKSMKELDRRAIAHHVVNASTVSDMGIPAIELGQCLAIDSAMGTGKTHWFAETWDQFSHSSRSAGGAFAIALTHRNTLGLSLGGRLGLGHVSEARDRGGEGGLITYSGGAAACIDSLHRLIREFWRRRQNGQVCLVIIDEIDAVLSHLVGGGCMSSDRQLQTWGLLSDLLKEISIGGGALICGEAQLSQLAIATIGKLAPALPITVWRNEATRIVKRINILETGKHISAEIAQQQAIAKILGLAEQGLRIFVEATSQRFGEVLDQLLTDLGIKVLRVDAKTITDPNVRAILSAPGDVIAGSGAQVVIASPSMSTGVSIEDLRGQGNLFDAVVILSTGLDSATTMQMIGRYRRADCPHFVYAATAGLGDRCFDADEILEKWRDLRDASMADLDLQQQANNRAMDLEQAAAWYKARENGRIATLRASLRAMLEAEGHHVSNMAPTPKDKEAIALWQNAKEIAIQESINEWIAADDQALTVEQARKQLDSDCNWGDYVQARKRLDRDQYFQGGDQVNDPNWIRRYWAASSAKRNRRAMQRASDFYSPGQSAERDRRWHTAQLETVGHALASRCKSDRAAAIAMAILAPQILDLLSLEKFNKTNPQLHALYWAMRHNAPLLKDAFGFEIGDLDQAAGHVNDLLRIILDCRLEREYTTIHWANLTPDQQANPGIDKAFTTAGGKRRKKTRIYQFTICRPPHWQAMIDGLTATHASYQEKQRKAAEAATEAQIDPQAIAMAAAAIAISGTAIKATLTDLALHWFPGKLREAIALMAPEIKALAGPLNAYA